MALRHVFIARNTSQHAPSQTSGDDTLHRQWAKVAYFLLHCAWPKMPHPDKATSKTMLEYLEANPELLASHNMDMQAVRQHELLSNNGFLLVKQFRDIAGVSDLLRVRTDELLDGIKLLAEHKLRQNRIKKTTTNAFNDLVSDVWKLMNSIGRSGTGTSNGTLVFALPGVKGDIEVPYYNPVNRKDFFKEVDKHVAYLKEADAREALDVAPARARRNDDDLSEDKHSPPFALRLAVLKSMALWTKVNKGLRAKADETKPMTAAKYMNAASNLLALSLSTSCSGKRYSDAARLKVDNVYFPFPDGNVPLAAVLAGEWQGKNVTRMLMEYLVDHKGPVVFDIPLAKLTCGAPSNDNSRKFESVKFARFPLPAGLAALDPIVCAVCCLCINFKFSQRPFYRFVCAQSQEVSDIKHAKSFVGYANNAKLYTPFAGGSFIQSILREVGGSTYGHRYQQLGEFFTAKADIKAVSVLMGHSNVMSQNFYIDNGVPLVVEGVAVRPHDIMKEDMVKSGCGGRLMGAVRDVGLDPVAVKELAYYARGAWDEMKANKVYNGWQEVVDGMLKPGKHVGVELYGIQECLLRPLGGDAPPLGDEDRKAVLGCIEEAFGKEQDVACPPLVRTQLQLCAQLDVEKKLGEQPLLEVKLLNNRSRLVSEIGFMPIWDKNADPEGLDRVDKGVRIRTVGRDLPDPVDPNAPRPLTKRDKAIHKLGSEMHDAMAVAVAAGEEGTPKQVTQVTQVTEVTEVTKVTKVTEEEEPCIEIDGRSLSLVKPTQNLTLDDMMRIADLTRACTPGTNLLIDSDFEATSYYYTIFRVTEGVTQLTETLTCQCNDVCFERGCFVVKGYFYEVALTTKEKAGLTSKRRRKSVAQSDDYEEKLAALREKKANSPPVQYVCNEENEAVVLVDWIAKAGIPTPDSVTLEMHEEYKRECL